jgi:hypothetical protein
MSVKKRASIHQFLRSETLQGLLAFQQSKRADVDDGISNLDQHHDEHVNTASQSGTSDSIQLSLQPGSLQGPASSSHSKVNAEVPALRALPALQASTALSNDRASATIIKFASEVFGVEVADEPELLALAREAHIAPVDLPWLEYTDSEGYIYYYNSSTKETSWDHPLTAFYRERLRLKQLELRSQVMSARVLSARESQRSDIGVASHRHSGAAVDVKHNHHLHFLNLGPAVRISTDQPKSSQESHHLASAKAHDAIHVAASTAQLSSLSQLLYVPNSSPAVSDVSISSAAPPIAKILAMKASSLDISINNLERFTHDLPISSPIYIPHPIPHTHPPFFFTASMVLPPFPV